MIVWYIIGSENNGKNNDKSKDKGNDKVKQILDDKPIPGDKQTPGDKKKQDRGEGNKDSDLGTMYEWCSTRCPQGLVCEKGRCKQPEGGKCSGSNDCSDNMVCHNWICERMDGIKSGLVLDLEHLPVINKKNKTRSVRF